MNKLTRTLIEKGYTATDHPPFVKVGGNGAFPDLGNHEGGFIYKRSYLEDKVFIAPCGLKCRYGTTFDNLFYNGHDYTYENDLAIMNCPKGCEDCRMRHEGLRDLSGVGKLWCAVSMTEGPYEYAGSAEELIDKAEKKKTEKRQAFMEENSKACINHMSYDGSKWHYKYDALTCVRQKCGKILTGTCPVFPMNKEKGNVFYDLVISYERADDKGTLFEGNKYTEIVKGKQLFDAPVSLTLANIIASKHPEEVLKKEKSRYSSELFYAEYHGRYFDITVQNIRAAKKEVRDLEQDLADMAAGIRVSHHRDDIRHAKKEKADRRTAHYEKKKQALRKKLIKTGYESLEEWSLDKKHVDQWFSASELTEIENERKSLIGAGLRQMDIFDLI